MGTGRAFDQTGPAMEKTLNPVFLYREQQIYLNLWSIDILHNYYEHRYLYGPESYGT